MPPVVNNEGVARPQAPPSLAAPVLNNESLEQRPGLLQLELQRRVALAALGEGGDRVREPHLEADEQARGCQKAVTLIDDNSHTRGCQKETSSVEVSSATPHHSP